MELKWIEDFLTLCATKNFRIAAKQRNVSQPAFSRRIQSLENWLDANLVDRSHHPSRLTEAGELFKPKAEEMLGLANSIRDDLRQNEADKAEKIRFSTLGALAQGFVPKWLKDLQPFIQVDQFTVRTEYQTTEEYFGALEDNSVDFFICYENSKIKFQTDGATFSSMKLGEETLIPVVSPSDDGTATLWLPDAPKEEISCLHCLPKTSPWPIRNHMDKNYRHLNFKTVYNSSLGPTLRAMALEGFGLAWVPFAIVADDLTSGRLVRAGGVLDEIAVDIIIYRRAVKLEPQVEGFWQALNVAQLASMPA